MTVLAAPISLELCHTYAPARLVSCDRLTQTGWKFNSDELDELHNKLDSLEQEVRDSFDLAGAKFTRLALLDEVVARDRQRLSEDPARHGLFIGASNEALRVGAKAEVFLESAFIDRAKELQKTITDHAKAIGLLIHDERELEIPTSRGLRTVNLVGFKGIADSSHPSCVLLDLAWTEWRARNYSETYTVLPVDYRKQQLDVAALAALIDLRNRGSVTAVFLDKSDRTVDKLSFADVNIRRD